MAADGAFQNDIYFAALADANDLRGSSAIGGNLQVPHASQNAEDLVRRTLGIVGVNLGDLVLAHTNFERGWVCLKQRRNVLRGEVGDDVSEPVHPQNHAP